MVSSVEPLFSKARMPNNEKQIIILGRLKSLFSNDVMELYATVKGDQSTCIGRVDIEDTFNCKGKLPKVVCVLCGVYSCMRSSEIKGFHSLGKQP